jgi:hypothetical protein
MNEILEEIVTSRPGAKPLSQSMTFHWLVVGAIGWTIQNLAAWLTLDQSDTATLAAGVFGFLTFVGALLGIMRRRGIRVPDWLVELIETALQGKLK